MLQLNIEQFLGKKCGLNVVSTEKSVWVKCLNMQFSDTDGYMFKSSVLLKNQLYRNVSNLTDMYLINSHIERSFFLSFL